MKKIAGVSILIWGVGLLVLAAAGAIAFPHIMEAAKPAPIVIVKKELWQNGGRYEVRGKIHNPRKQPAKNVMITFEMMESTMGANNKIMEKHAGKACARFDYVPAKESVDFTAASEVTVKKLAFVGIDDGALSEGR